METSLDKLIKCYQLWLDENNLQQLSIDELLCELAGNSEYVKEIQTLQIFDRLWNKLAN